MIGRTAAPPNAMRASVDGSGIVFDVRVPRGSVTPSAQSHGDKFFLDDFSSAIGPRPNGRMLYGAGVYGESIRIGGSPGTGRFNTVAAS